MLWRGGRAPRRRDRELPGGGRRTAPATISKVEMLITSVDRHVFGKALGELKEASDAMAGHPSILIRLPVDAHRSIQSVEIVPVKRLHVYP